MRVVVFPAPGNPLGMDEWCKPVENNWHLVSLELKTQIEEQGWELDVYPTNVDEEEDFGLYFEHTPIGLKCRMSICILQEPPVIRPYAYKHASYLPYDRVLTYNMDIVDDKKVFYLNFPTPSYRGDVSDVKRDKYMVAIYSNKTSTHPEQLYTARRQLILGMGKDIDLYGHGWHNDPEVVNTVNYKGVCGDKIRKMAEYTYALYVENQIVRGWNSEKLYHILQSGAMPHPWRGNRRGILPLAAVGEELWAKQVVKHIRETI